MGLARELEKKMAEGIISRRHPIKPEPEAV